MQAIHKLWQRALKQFPCILVTGPKHPSKTELLNSFAGEKYQSFNLENPEVRAKSEKSSDNIFENINSSYLLEEIQHSPQISESIKKSILIHPEQNGKFILSSSFSVKELNGVTSPLSGLTSILHFIPTCWTKNSSNSLSPFECKYKSINSKNESELLDTLRLGYSNSIDGKKDKYYSQWLQVYMERDLPRIRNIENISDFQYFLKKLTDYNGRPLNMAELARTLGLSLNTVKAWVSVLEESFIITLVKPLRKNYGIRLKKTPNIYFQDPGLVAYLNEITDNKQLKKSPYLIGMMESLVVNDLMRWFYHEGSKPPIYLWNPSNEEQSVIVLETVNELFIFDISLKAKQNMGEFKKYNQLIEIYKERLIIYNIHLEESLQLIEKNIHSIPLSWLSNW